MSGFDQGDTDRLGKKRDAAAEQQAENAAARLSKQAFQLSQVQRKGSAKPGQSQGSNSTNKPSSTQNPHNASGGGARNTPRQGDSSGLDKSPPTPRPGKSTGQAGAGKQAGSSRGATQNQASDKMSNEAFDTGKQQSSAGRGSVPTGGSTTPQHPDVERMLSGFEIVDKGKQPGSAAGSAGTSARSQGASRSSQQPRPVSGLPSTRQQAGGGSAASKTAPPQPRPHSSSGQNIPNPNTPNQSSISQRSTSRSTTGQSSGSRGATSQGPAKPAPGSTGAGAPRSPASGQHYSITSHGKQPSPRPTGSDGKGMESHHPESQSRLGKNIANYNPRADRTILLTNTEHKAVTRSQRGQLAQADHNKKLGTTEAVKDSAAIMERAGVPAGKAGQAAIAHSGYLFSTTPLDKVKAAIQGAAKAIAKIAGGKTQSASSKSAGPGSPSPRSHSSSGQSAAPGSKAAGGASSRSATTPSPRSHSSSGPSAGPQPATSHSSHSGSQSSTAGGSTTGSTSRSQGSAGSASASQKGASSQSGAGGRSSGSHSPSSGSSSSSLSGGSGPKPHGSGSGQGAGPG